MKTIRVALIFATVLLRSLGWAATLPTAESDTMISPVTAVVLILIVLAGVVLKMWYEHRQRKSKRLFCVDCETVSPYQEPRRSAWTWMLLGTFCLLWRKKLTCPACGGHTLVPSNSPRALKAMSA